MERSLKIFSRSSRFGDAAQCFFAIGFDENIGLTERSKACDVIALSMAFLGLPPSQFVVFKAVWR